MEFLDPILYITRAWRWWTSVGAVARSGSWI